MADSVKLRNWEMVETISVSNKNVTLNLLEGLEMCNVNLTLWLFTVGTQCFTA